MKKKKENDFVVEKSIKIETKDEVITLEEGDKIQVLNEAKWEVNKKDFGVVNWTDKNLENLSICYETIYNIYCENNELGVNVSILEEFPYPHFVKDYFLMTKEFSSQTEAMNFAERYIIKNCNLTFDFFVENGFTVWGR